MGKTTWRAGAVALVGVAAITLAACGGSSGGNGGGGGGGGGPVKGGTLTVLSFNDKLQHLDPQLIYTGEDAAMAQSWWQRQLVVYKVSPDAAVSTTLQGDLAEDTGTPNSDGTQWVFKLRQGVKWADGSDLKCADIARGIARQFDQSSLGGGGGGPTYMVGLLDIPKDKDGTSAYKGVYKKTGQDLFDKAVVCADDNSTITFNLNQPSPDFNYALIWGTGPVPADKDNGAKYDLAPMTSGPYQITSNETNKELVLDRNPNWDQATDPYRPAYPDKIVIKFGIEQTEIDQRLIADSGEDKDALSYGSMDASVLSTVFNDPTMEPRRLNEFSPYSIYLGINTKLVPNEKIRQAMAVALDRGQIRTNAGGDFAGPLADSVVKPNIGADYAPTGMWTDMFGQAVPDSGDPELAKKLIAESGETPPTIRYQYRGGTPTAEKNAGVFKTSLEKAGFKVELEQLATGDYYTIIFDDKKAHEVMSLGWGADWPNASTVLGPLFTSTGAWNLSRVHDTTFDQQVADASKNLDRAAQSTAWHDLAKYAMQKAWAIPTLFENDQRLAGSGVHSASAPAGRNVYMWAGAGSWPYVDLYVTS